MVSHRNTVIDNLVAALAAADGSGSYSNDLTGNVKVGGWDSVNDPIMPMLEVFEGREDYTETRFHVAVEKELQVFIRVWQKKDPGANWQDGAKELLADLERALMADWRLSDSVISLTLVGNEVFQDAERKDRYGVVLEVQVRYRSDFENPNTSGPA